MTTTSPPWRRLTVLATSAALAGAALTGPLAGAPTPAAAAAGGTTTITPNPASAGDAFEGWGTSLVWFANATADYPAALREQLYQAVFGDDGLDLNIARYNIGGGNASDVPDYLRPGGAVEGWWAPNADGSARLYGGVPTTFADRDRMLAAWNPDDPTSYNEDADANQRWWVQRLASEHQITHWETFANSAPYFMTESGYVSGGLGDGSAPQLKPAAADAFATYLTRVTERLEQQYGIRVDTIEPLNEPLGWWRTDMVNGKPRARQEGMYVPAAQQATLLDALHAELAKRGTTTRAKVAGMDESTPGGFSWDWSQYSASTRSHIAQMNVHTYNTGGRLNVRDLAKQADTSLWMSEDEGSWVSGYNPVSIENGIGLAGHMIDDLRELEPKAWVFWQPVEDLYNMEPHAENSNWGSILVDLDCRAYQEDGTTVWKSARRVADAGGDSTKVQRCGVTVNSKFNVTRNFTKFIHEGDRLMAVDDAASTAALRADGTGATIVHTNDSAAAQTVTIDLSNFGTIAPGATVTPVVTTQAASADQPTSNSLVRGTPVAIDAAARTATLTIPAKSVTTFVIDGVSGTSADAPALHDGHRYEFVGAQSGKALTAGAADATATSIRTQSTDPAVVANQVWTVHEVDAGDRAGTRRVVLEASDGRVLAATPAGTELRSIAVDTAKTDAATRWIVNTTDGRVHSLVNEAEAEALDVGGQSTADGASVGVWPSNGADNQAWSARDLAPEAVQTVAAHTQTGVIPVLPETIAPRYAWGAGVPVPVTWKLPDAGAWTRNGRVDVPGTATDVFGQTVKVTALVDVGGLTATDPVSVTVAAGTPTSVVRANAPTSVPARMGASENAFAVPVTWNWDAVTNASFEHPGVVRVPGTASVDGGSLSAQLAVIVTAGVLRNINPEAGTVASASYTESGYSADGTRNGVLGDKAWTTWRPDPQLPQASLTYEYPAAHAVRKVAVHFYDDGWTNWAQAIQVQLKAADGTWSAAPGWETPHPVTSTDPAPTVTAEFAPTAANGVRVVMDAHPDSYLAASEVEVFESVPGAGSVADLAALRLDGVSVTGFDPAVRAYTVDVEGGRLPALTAIATDSAATVRVTQPSTASGAGSVSVVSADGAVHAEYTVIVRRHATITGLALAARPRVGTPMSATGRLDPADGTVAYQWLRNGVPIATATGATYTPVTNDAGKLLSVRVTVAADGVAPATSETPAQRIVAANSAKP